MELDCDGPATLDAEWDLGLQGLHGSLEAVDVLGVQSLEPVLLAETGEHFMELGGLALGRLNRERPHQFMEGACQGIILVDGGVEEQLAGSLEVVLLLQRLEQSISGAEIGNCQLAVSSGFEFHAKRGYRERA